MLDLAKIWNSVLGSPKDSAPLCEIPKTAFLHIPKTAGTTVHHILLNCFPGGRIFTNAERGNNQKVDPSTFDFVSGHFNYSYLIERGLTGHRVITIFRDPVGRALSHFYFLKQDRLLDLVEQEDEAYDQSELELAREVLAKARENDLAEFIRKEPFLANITLGDYQTRLMGAPDKLAPLDSSHLDLALKHLRDCFFVGLTERMNESVALLCQRMGWPQILPQGSLNSNKENKGKRQQPPELLEVLKDLNRMDQVLYDEAQKLFEESLKNPVADRFPIPDAANFTPEQSILGEGWHIRDKENGEWICWSGPESKSWLELTTTLQSSAQMTIGLFMVIHPEVFERLKLSVNGVDLPHTILRDGEKPRLKVAIPGKIMRAANGRLRLGIDTGVTHCPADLFSGSPDQRKLGLAITGIQLKKASLF